LRDQRERGHYLIATRRGELPRWSMAAEARWGKIRAATRHSGPAANLPRTPLRFVPRRRSPNADVRRTPVRVDSRGGATVALPEPRIGATDPLPLLVL